MRTRTRDERKSGEVSSARDIPFGAPPMLRRESTLGGIHPAGIHMTGCRRNHQTIPHCKPEVTA